jgi:FdhE protein
MKNGKWDARISRAGQLASVHPSAAEGLRFYERIAQIQKSLYADFESECGATPESRAPGTLRAELDLFVLLPRFSPFLSLIEQHAPGPLAQAAARLHASGGTRWQEALLDFWLAEKDASGGLDSPEALIAWIFLQPYAEYLADYTLHPPIHGTPLICPFCSSMPQVGVLRPEGDGGKRSLICSLCSQEWNFRRLICASCGEEDVNKLGVFSTAQLPYIRVEACDTCHRYIKTVDMTKDGHAVPVVDELATIPLNLWAAEHGYTKLHANLLGI